MATLSVADARAEALFASLHDPSEVMSAADVEAAIREALRRLGGVRGCVVCVAGEFGDHPDLAAARMAWARAVVADTYRKQAQR
jgi:hypothetical protein